MRVNLNLLSWKRQYLILHGEDLVLLHLAVPGVVIEQPPPVASDAKDVQCLVTSCDVDSDEV